GEHKAAGLALGNDIVHRLFGFFHVFFSFSFGGPELFQNCVYAILTPCAPIAAMAARDAAQNLAFLRSKNALSRYSAQGEQSIVRGST
ncbi:MAG: hypothetical protein PUK11_05075, partial [Oscillibacter sp.]|nr:hypothetical protein [Oscillibacter sp.]MDY5711307.1 hypothetical protein [Oscillospiraceae bacterium]